MRRYAQTLLLALGLMIPTTIMATEQGALAQREQTSGETEPSDSWGEQDKPQNYVPSKGPSEDGGSYNWIQMGYAGLVMVLMIGFMAWLIKRTPGKSRREGTKAGE